jgi:hypothetical protein
VYAQSAWFMAPGYYAVVLSDGERNCIIPNGNNYTYKKRMFKIVLLHNNKETTLAEVPETLVYGLNAKAGKWDEIRGVVIKYE